MTGQLETILLRYGQNVTLEKRDTGNRQNIRAFLQPILKKQEHPPATVTPLGAVSEQRWSYIGSGRIPISPGDRIRHSDLTLIVQAARDVYLGESLLYYWALLQPDRGSAV